MHSERFVSVRERERERDRIYDYHFNMSVVYVFITVVCNVLAYANVFVVTIFLMILFRPLSILPKFNAYPISSK